MPSKKPNGGGYGQPPEETRFVKGQSGNPKGRPKGSKNFATRYLAEFNSKSPITENGKKKKLAKLDIIIKRQANTAMAGDSKVVEQVIDRVIKLEGRSTGSPVGPFTDEDREVIRAIYERLVQLETKNDDSDV